MRLLSQRQSDTNLGSILLKHLVEVLLPGKFAENFETRIVVKTDTISPRKVHAKGLGPCLINQPEEFLNN